MLPVSGSGPTGAIRATGAGMTAPKERRSDEDFLCNPRYSGGKAGCERVRQEIYRQLLTGITVHPEIIPDQVIFQFFFL
jgi:hypothetical protein